MGRLTWKIIFGFVLQLALAGYAQAQTTTYHLHKEASTTAGLFQLKTAGPDGTTLAAQSSNLKNLAIGEYIVKAFDTQTGVPNTSGVIPAGSTITFTLWMKKSSSSGTMYPRAKLRLNSSSGTLIGTATSASQLTTTLTKYTLTATTSSNVSMTTSDRFYLWVGVNLTAIATSNTNAVLNIEGTLNGNYNSTVAIPTPIPAPTISNLSPTSGAIGASVTVTGTNFGATQGTSTLAFNGTTATATSWNNTSIVTTVPAGATSGQVVVTKSGLASNGVAFTVTPSIDNLTPASGPVGTSVTITGTSFGATQGTSTIAFNGTTATVTSWNNTSIVATVPAGATSGPVVVTRSGSASNGVTFTVTPKIDSLTPASGPVGTSVTITGTSFGATQGTSTIAFNGITATPSSWGNLSIAALVPTGTSSGPVIVTVSGALSNGVQFTLVSQGTIAGRVTQADGVTAIVGSQVRVFQGSTIIATTTTNGTGDYTVAQLNAGSYAVEALAFGYAAQSKNGTVTAGSTASINFSLSNAGPVTYVYDELGRLVGLVDTGGDAVTYKYDAVGNLLSISRQNSNQPSIIEFTPNGGVVGTPVTIYGTAFSTTASQNTVTFNGTAATVSSATATQIVANVPTEATTGPIVVTAPAGPATSTTPFTVTAIASGAPTIGGFTPAIGVPGTALTITGTNFDVVGSNNKLKVNSLLSEVALSTSTSVVSSIPNGGSGRITVSTPMGTGVSSADLFIPRAPYTATDVGFTGRMNVGDTQTVSINMLNKVGMMLFEGIQGQKVSFRFGPTTMGQVSFWIYDTNGLPIHRYANPNPSESLYPAGGVSEKFIDTIVLPRTGTYTIFVYPPTSAGNLQISIYDVAPDITNPITIGGSAVAVTTTTQGQNGRLSFDGTAGQKVSLKTANTTMSASIQIYNPYNGTLGPGVAISPGYEAFIDQQLLPVTGSYAILVDPGGASTGTTNITLHNAADVTGTMIPGSGAVTQTINSPGQNIRLTFSGTTGQQVSLNVTSGTLTTYDIYILKPDGTTLAYVNTPSGFPGNFIDKQTLPVDGTYTVLIDGYGASTGSVAIALYDVSQDVTGTISIGGTAVPLTINTPGQNANFTFSASAGQKVSLTLSGVTVGSRVYLKKPDGTNLTSADVYPPGRTIDTQTLPVGGTYSIFVDPFGANTGNMTLTLNDASDVTATITPGGSPVTVTTSIPGQNAVLSFSGTSGQRISLKLSSYGIAYWVYIKRPNGTDITQRFVNSGFTGDFIDPVTLDTTGTHTIVVDPYDTYTGSVTLTLYDVPPDTSGTVTIGGSTVTATITTPGQNSTLTFDGTSGQQVTVHVTNNTINGVTVRLVRANGSTLTSLQSFNSSFDLTTQTLPATETYTIKIDPILVSTGSMSVSVTNP